MSKKIEKPTNVKFTSIDSSVKGMKEFIVTFEQNGKQLKDFIFVEEKKGYSNNDYLNVAREEFARHLQKGIRQVKTTSAPFKAFGLCCGAAALTFAGLFTWKILDQSKTITWDLGDGTLVKEKYKLGELPSYKGKVPEIPDDTEYDENRIKWHHTFDGWQEEIIPVYEDTTYHINYKKEPLCFVAILDIDQHWIDDGCSTFEFDTQYLTEEEMNNWVIDWGEKNPDVDKKEFSHTYKTSGIKYMKIRSNPVTVNFLNDGDPDTRTFMLNIVRRVYFPYGLTTNEYYHQEDGALAMFYAQNNLETIVFPSTLTRIQSLSFNDGELVEPTVLKYLDIPTSVKTIDPWAFSGVLMSDLVIPSTVTKIKENAFRDSCIDYLKLPKTITNYPEKSLCSNQLIYPIFDFRDYDVPPTVSSDAFPLQYDLIKPCSILVREDTYDKFYNAWHGIVEDYILDCIKIRIN